MTSSIVTSSTAAALTAASPTATTPPTMTPRKSLSTRTAPASEALPPSVIFLEPPAESPSQRDPHRPTYHFAPNHDELPDRDFTPWRTFADASALHGPAIVDLASFQDHCTWRDEDDGSWYRLVGGDIRGEGGTALLYRSLNQKEWDYLHPLTETFTAADLHGTGDRWESPDLIPLPDGQTGRFSGKHLLVVSASSASAQAKGQPSEQTFGFLGTYRDQRFVPEERVSLDPGGYFYAPRSLADERGSNRLSRRLQWGWLGEGRSAERQCEAGWSGVMSLPRELFLHRDGTLGVRPAAELSALRQSHRRFDSCPIDDILNRDLAAVRGDSLEIIAEIEPRDAARIDLELRCTPSGTRGSGDECTRLFYDRILDRIGIDRWRSTRHIDGVDRDVRSTDFTTPRRRRYSTKREPLRLHVFLDCSVLEVFINEQLYLSSRIYPDCVDSLGLRLHVTGGRAALRSLDVWEMGSL